MSPARISTGTNSQSSTEVQGQGNLDTLNELLNVKVQVGGTGVHATSDPSVEITEDTTTKVGLVPNITNSLGLSNVA